MSTPRHQRTLTEERAQNRFRLVGPKQDELIEEREYLSGPRGALAHLMVQLHGRLVDTERLPFVVVHYGDSHSQAGRFSDAMRTRLFDKANSPGYISHRFPYAWNASTTKSSGWRRQNWLRRDDIPPYGPLGIAFVAQDAGETIAVKLSDRKRPDGSTRITVFYDSTAEHRGFSLDADGVEKRVVKHGTVAGPESTDNPFLVEPDSDTTLAAVTLEVSRRTKTITLTTDGGKEDAQLRVFGFLIQYEQAHAEWDVLAIAGTTIDSVMKRGDGSVEAYLAFRQPNLFVAWYGTNSLNNPKLDAEKYAGRYRAFMDRFAAAAPQAACLVVGPPDFMKRDRDCFLTASQRRARRKRNSASRRILRKNKRQRVCEPDLLIDHKKRGRYRFPVPDVRTMAQWAEHKVACEYKTRPLMEAVIEQQKRIAHAAGCLYFDTYAYMGGPGSIKKWACDEDPQLASLDLIHLTASGYRKLGEDLVRAINEASSRENLP
ncbi:MAG: hypothetical protein ACON3Z_01100 [Bradymonadia bacterium]